MVVETSKGKLPVRFGMSALAEFGDLTDKTMNEVLAVVGDFGNMKLSEVLAFVYIGFKDGARHKDEECKVASMKEVGDMIDEDPELITRVTKVFIGDGEESGEEPKKK